jgi:hypothetical protein
MRNLLRNWVSIAYIDLSMLEKFSIVTYIFPERIKGQMFYDIYPSLRKIQKRC